MSPNSGQNRALAQPSVAVFDVFVGANGRDVLVHVSLDFCKGFARGHVFHAVGSLGYLSFFESIHGIVAAHVGIQRFFDLVFVSVCNFLFEGYSAHFWHCRGWSSQFFGSLWMVDKAWRLSGLVCRLYYVHALW